MVFFNFVWYNKTMPVFKLEKVKDNYIIKVLTLNPETKSGTWYSRDLKKLGCETYRNCITV